MEKSFKTVIDQSNSILLLLPKNPDFDQVAAALSLFLAVDGKKDVVISCPTEMRVEHNRLVGINKISQEIGNKNLVLRFSDYPAENIERVSYDVENQQFRLSIIPKSEAEPPKKDQVLLSYSGVSADTTILVGGQTAADYPAFQGTELADTKIVHIGTSDISTPDNVKVISLSRPASSVSELMAEYVREIEGGYHPDIASNLLSGIHEGSDGFTAKNVSAATFKLAGDLMAAGGKYTKKEENISKAYPGFNFPVTSGMPQISNFQFPPKAQLGASKTDDITPEKEADEAPEGETIAPPASWLNKPKIYKGTSVS